MKFNKYKIFHSWCNWFIVVITLEITFNILFLQLYDVGKSRQFRRMKLVLFQNNEFETFWLVLVIYFLRNISSQPKSWFKTVCFPMNVYVLCFIWKSSMLPTQVCGRENSLMIYIWGKEFYTTIKSFKKTK